MRSGSGRLKRVVLRRNAGEDEGHPVAADLHGRIGFDVHEAYFLDIPKAKKTRLSSNNNRRIAKEETK